jgi:predicted Zn finger-like uncharacterized protein
MLIVCDHCQATVRVPDDAAGRSGKCPRCGNLIRIPEAGADRPAAETGYASQIPASLPPASPPPLARPSRRDDRDDRDHDPPSRYDDNDRDFDADIRLRAPRRRSQSIALSVTGMVLGLASLLLVVATIAVSAALPAAIGGADVCCFSFLGGYSGLAISGLLGLLGAIFSFVGMGQGGLAYAWTGAIASILTIVVVVVLVVLTIIFGLVIFMAIAALVGAAAQQPPPGPAPPVRRR